MKKRFRGYALIVTVEQNTHDRLPNLGEGVTADGNLIERVLLDEDVCGYGSDRVIRLGGKSATAENIHTALATLRKTVEPEDPVFFYFSGHGDASSCDGSEGASLFPWNADIDRCENVLTSGLLAQAWGAIPSKRKLAVVDACYSGGLRMTKSTAVEDKRLSRPKLNALSEGEGSVLISSSRSVEPSLILPQDSTSLFTKHLANGLLGYGGHDGDGFVRVFDLFNYVAVEVQSEASKQSPVYAAYHQDQNFAVAYCVDAKRRKMRKSLTETTADISQLQTITAVFCSLYPLGPTDQGIWERAGGDLSQLQLNGRGRTDWFRAIQLMDRGGGSLTIEMLCREALLDYPRNRDLEFLQRFYPANTL
ncbi:MAG: caspase family protein [Candidatus Dadabacteria bacterium]|nr:caspase family protein [Candidatus Dadabacteria bacterium]